MSEKQQVEGTVNGEPYSVPEGYMCVPRERVEAGAAVMNLLGELDRSPNGRHVGDSEFQDPTGTSQGNALLTEGTHIGHNIAGRRIVVPSPEKLQDPAAWIARPTDV